MDLEQAKKEIQKRYGGEAIFTFDGSLEKPSVYSTGSLSLDWNVLRIGGIPRGRFTEISGPDGSGKTTVSLHTIANAQRQQDIVALIDAENKLDLRYAHALGVDLDKLLLSQPDDGEEAIDIADALCKVPEVGLIVFDSAAALGGKSEREKDFIDNAEIAKIPRLLNKFFRRNASNIRKNDIAVIFTNQLREKVNSMYAGQTTTTGGRGLQHYASILLTLRRKGDLKSKDVIIGQEVVAVAKKNNIDKPKRVGTFKIWYGTGIDMAAELIEFGVEAGVVTKRGSFYSYGDIRLAQGLDNARNFLNDTPELLATIQEEVTEWLNENLV